MYHSCLRHCYISFLLYDICNKHKIQHTCTYVTKCNFIHGKIGFDILVINIVYMMQIVFTTNNCIELSYFVSHSAVNNILFSQMLVVRLTLGVPHGPSLGAGRSTNSTLMAQQLTVREAPLLWLATPWMSLVVCSPSICLQMIWWTLLLGFSSTNSTFETQLKLPYCIQWK